MDKKKLIDALSQRVGISKRDSEIVIDAVFEIITNTLETGSKVKVPNFGIFEVKARAARTGRNPKADTPVYIPAKKVPYFTPSKVLKSRVEESQKQYKISKE